MFKRLNDKDRKRLKRKVHIRKRIHGTAERPRMTVTRSNSNLAVQVINDDTGCTLASVSTLEKDLAVLKANIAAGSKVGEEIGRRLGIARHPHEDVLAPPDHTRFGRRTQRFAPQKVAYLVRGEVQSRMLYRCQGKRNIGLLHETVPDPT